MTQRNLSGRGANKRKPIALDRSLRSVDADGHMRVEESRISKANICPYIGREIPDYQRLGLDPTRIYKLFRDPKELEKGASSFDGKPLLIRHVAIDAELPRKDLWVGTVGPTKWEEPYLVTRPLMVLTQEAIDLINKGSQRELSAAYRYDAVMEPGTWGGQSYDGRMVNIRGNHVAIVSEGRVGPDVHVADEAPPEFSRMKNAAAVAAKAIAPFVKSLPLEERKKIALALDGELGETPAESVISLDDGEMKKALDEALAEKKKEHGEDAELDDKDKEKAFERARDRKAKDRAKDKAKDSAAKDKAKDGKGKDEFPPKAKDAKGKDAMPDKGEDAASHLTGEDADPDHRKDFDPAKGKDSVTKDELSAAVKSAQDAMRTQMRELAVAREAVRPIVGAVSLAMDSAEDVYKFALTKAGVKTEGVHASALPSLIELVVANKKRSASAAIAMDASNSADVDLDAIFSPKAAA